MQNLDVVVRDAREVEQRARNALTHGALPLVLGGGCSLELGTMAGHLPDHADLALLYFDTLTRFVAPLVDALAGAPTLTSTPHQSTQIVSPAASRGRERLSCSGESTNTVRGIGAMATR
jgi:hypothetical protein